MSDIRMANILMVDVQMSDIKRTDKCIVKTANLQMADG
jgi:hypothetical protein